MLNSTDVQLRYDEALEAQSDAETILDNLRAAAVVLDEPTGPEEAAAVETVRKAREHAERLAGALTAVLQAEHAERRRLAAADRAAQDAATLAALGTLDKAAVSFDRAAEVYAKAWLKLHDAATACQGEIARRQGVVRADLRIPSLASLAGNYLAKVSPIGSGLPGAKVSGLIHDPTQLPSVADVMSSLAEAVRQDIGAARAPVAA